MRNSYGGSMNVWQLFIRHAHRDLDDRSVDNGLSEKGKRQCDALVQYLEELKSPRMPVKVFSSPKRRCVETAEYVAAWAGVEVEIEPLLNEQQPKEGDRDFLERVLKWRDSTQRLTQHCFVSHADVLPVICRHYGSFVSEIKKGDLFFVENKIIKQVNDVHVKCES